MSLTQKIAIAAGALTLGVAGVAAASTAPDAADTGLTKASEQVGVELPADSASADATSDESVETANGEGTGPVDNHGADVSAVAQSDFASGREHGEAVSAVAQDNDDADASDDAAEQSTLGTDNAGEHGRP